MGVFAYGRAGWQAPTDTASATETLGPERHVFAGWNHSRGRNQRKCGAIMEIVGWRAASGFRGIKLGVTGLAFSPDGALLASLSRNDIVRIWRVSDWELLPAGDRMQQKTLRTLAFSPDGLVLAVGAQFWRVADRKLIRTLEADGFDADHVDSVAFSQDNALLAIASTFLKGLWQVADGEFLCRLDEGGFVSHSDLTWSPDGSLLITADKTIQLWSWLRR